MASGWWKSSHTNLAAGLPADFTVHGAVLAPRGYPKIASIATGAGLFLGGTPCVTVDNVLYYAGDDYVQDTDKPTLCRYDGRVSTEVLELPFITGSTPSKAILSIVTDDDEDCLFISTWDSGTTSSDFVGRVYAYDLADGTLTRVDGGLFTGGKLPYALAWFNSALYVGVTKQNPSSTTEVIKLSVNGALPGGPSVSATVTGTTWTYEVGALNGSPAFGFFTANTPQTSVQNRASLDSTFKNDLSWGSSPVGTQSYRVKRVAPAGANVIADIPSAATTTYTDNGADNSLGGYTDVAETMTLTVTPNPAQSTTTTYYVTAVVNGFEFISAAASCSATATLYSDLYVALSWSAVTDATSYKIYRTAGHSSTGLIGTTSATTFNDTGLAGDGASLPEVYSTVALTSGAVGCLVPFNGDLYIGSYQPAATFGKVYKLTTGGVLTTSHTAAPGGTAQAYNGYTAGIVFEDNLYMGYWNDDATDICLLEKLTTGGVWSTVNTISGAGARPWVGFCEADGNCWAYGGGDAKTGILYNSADGSSWTDQSALLPSSKEAIPFMGNANILGGF